MLLPIRRLHHLFDAGTMWLAEKSKKPSVLRDAGTMWLVFRQFLN
ncbi:hypothetical protein RLW55_10410 [Hyphomicrobium sp. B1]